MPGFPIYGAIRAMRAVSAIRAAGAVRGVRGGMMNGGGITVVAQPPGLFSKAAHHAIALIGGGTLAGSVGTVTAMALGASNPVALALFVPAAMSGASAADGFYSEKHPNTWNSAISDMFAFAAASAVAVGSVMLGIVDPMIVAGFAGGTWLAVKEFTKAVLNEAHPEAKEPTAPTISPPPNTAAPAPA